MDSLKKLDGVEYPEREHPISDDLMEVCPQCGGPLTVLKEKTEKFCPQCKVTITVYNRSQF